jgi:hypothetical protein
MSENVCVTIEECDRKVKNMNKLITGMIGLLGAIIVLLVVDMDNSTRSNDRATEAKALINNHLAAEDVRDDVLKQNLARIDASIQQLHVDIKALGANK